MRTPINASGPPRSESLSVREISDSDIDAVINLLVRGFPRPRRYWEIRLGRLRTRLLPPNTPRYGYLLEASGKPAGVILLISSLRRMNDRQQLFSNLSGWYVEPEFRSGATQLLRHALANKQCTFLNLYPAMHVRPIMEAFGFTRYSEGQILTPLALARNRRTTRVTILGAASLADSGSGRGRAMVAANAGELRLPCFLLCNRRANATIRLCAPHYQGIYPMCSTRLLP